MNNVASSSEELTASAEQTSKATEHITLAIEQFSNGNESQSENIESAAEHIYQMNSGLEDMAKASAVITESSATSAEVANSGGKLVHQTVQMNVIDRSVKEAEQVVRGLETKSKDITNILRVINGIADQTNLLALNAAIEAARAGEYGLLSRRRRGQKTCGPVCRFSERNRKLNYRNRQRNQYISRHVPIRQQRGGERTGYYESDRNELQTDF